MAPPTFRAPSKFGALTAILTVIVVWTRWLDFPAVELLAMAQALWPIAAITALGAGFVLAIRRKWALIAAVAPAIALSAAGLGYDLSPGVSLSKTKATAVPTLSIAAINMKQARGSTSDVAAAVKSLDVDVLVLLEVDDLVVSDLRSRPELAAFRSSSGPARPDTVAGSAILSRLPITEAKQDVGPVLAGDLQQPALYLTLPGHERVAIFGAHPLPPLPGLAGTWAREIAGLCSASEQARSAGYRTVVAGDFNATRDHPAFRKFLRNATEVSKPWGFNPSWPSSRPFLPLDHVVASGFDPIDRGTFAVRGSDHEGRWVHLALSAVGS